MHHDELAPLEELFRALANRVRLAILTSLSERPRCVHELVDDLGLSQPLISQHLRVLRSTNLVAAERHGTEMHYSLSDGHIAQMVADATAHAQERRKQ